MPSWLTCKGHVYGYVTLTIESARISQICVIVYNRIDIGSLCPSYALQMEGKLCTNRAGGNLQWKSCWFNSETGSSNTFIISNCINKVLATQIIGNSKAEG